MAEERQERQLQRREQADESVRERNIRATENLGQAAEEAYGKFSAAQDKKRKRTIEEEQLSQERTRFEREGQQFDRQMRQMDLAEESARTALERDRKYGDRKAEADIASAESGAESAKFQAQRDKAESQYWFEPSAQNPNETNFARKQRLEQEAQGINLATAQQQLELQQKNLAVMEEQLKQSREMAPLQRQQLALNAQALRAQINETEERISIGKEAREVENFKAQIATIPDPTARAQAVAAFAKKGSHIDPETGKRVLGVSPVVLAKAMQGVRSDEFQQQMTARILQMQDPKYAFKVQKTNEALQQGVAAKELIASLTDLETKLSKGDVIFDSTYDQAVSSAKTTLANLGYHEYAKELDSLVSMKLEGRSTRLRQIAKAVGEQEGARLEAVSMGDAEVMQMAKDLKQSEAKTRYGSAPAMDFTSAYRSSSGGAAQPAARSPGSAPAGGALPGSAPWMRRTPAQQGAGR